MFLQKKSMRDILENRKKFKKKQDNDILKQKLKTY